MSNHLQTMANRRPPSSFVSRYRSRQEESDKCLMMMGSLALTAIGLASRSWAGLLLAGVGGCLAYQLADRRECWTQREAHQEEIDHPETDNLIDEAGVESFPASDSPAHSTFT